MVKIKKKAYNKANLGKSYFDKEQLKTFHEIQEKYVAVLKKILSGNTYLMIRVIQILKISLLY